MNPLSFPHLSRQGFTLVELLSVVAIVGLLTAAAIPVLNTGNNEMNHGLQVTAGMLEQARQYAISRNTYTWLVIGGPSTTQDMQVGVVASKDGTDVLSWSAAPVDLSASTVYEMVGRIGTVSRVSVADTPSVTIGSLPDTDGTTPGRMAKVDFTQGTGAQARTFTRAVQFTPTGEARVAGSVDRFIDLVLMPKNGPASAPNQAVIRVSGLTGRSAIYRN